MRELRQRGSGFVEFKPFKWQAVKPQYPDSQQWIERRLHGHQHFKLTVDYWDCWRVKHWWGSLCPHLCGIFKQWLLLLSCSSSHTGDKASWYADFAPVVACVATTKGIRCSLGMLKRCGLPPAYDLSTIRLAYIWLVKRSTHIGSCLWLCIFSDQKPWKTYWKAQISQLFSWACFCYLDLLRKTISASIILDWMYSLLFISSNMIFTFFHRWVTSVS